MLKLTYKGRTITNGRALADAVSRDLNEEIERRVRRAAAASGVHVRKTSKGLEVEGDADKMSRFNNRLGR